MRLRKAAELVAESAKPIPIEQAAAREQIWTPEKGEGEGEAAEPAAADEPQPGKLWTPGP